VIGAATPLLLAALGELVVEKSGVLNLGVEGMMLVGAVAAFATAVGTESVTLAILAAAIAGAVMALLFGLLTLTLLASQVATGLALTIFGIGLSALIGAPYVGTPLKRLPQLQIPGLSDLPVIGPLLFSHDILVYFGVAMVAVLAWFLNRSRPGLVLRAVGESHEAAHAIGYPVIMIRYLAVMFGGMMAGLGGAYLFGGVTILQLHAQGGSLIDIPSQFLSMLPYIATILVLTFMSSGAGQRRLRAPACLGRPFHPTA
jgi:simple sugar transport system permease protein